jgi:hypothetical protein
VPVDHPLDVAVDLSIAAHADAVVDIQARDDADAIIDLSEELGVVDPIACPANPFPPPTRHDGLPDC